MAHIERRRIRRPDATGRLRVVTRYRVRYRDESGRQHCETKTRLVDAERQRPRLRSPWPEGPGVLRQCLDAAIADSRLQFNPATAVLLPTERQKPPRYLSQSEVERLVDEVPPHYRALVLVGAYAGLRWGEAAGLRRRDIDPLRSRIRVTSTAVELRGRVTLDNEPKTTRSKRSVPVARSVMRRLELHLSEFVDPTSDALLFTAPAGGPLFRSWGRTVLRPAVLRAELDEITFHGLRHSFVAIMVAAGCNVHEVSEWAGHNSVAFTLTRYGGLFEDNADAAIDRLDALLGNASITPKTK